MVREKVLVIRFNSIGDIVLTSPVIQCLHDNNYEVHYICKKTYKPLLVHNPHVAQIWTLDENVNPIIENLKKEKYKYVVDLHNNLRSSRVKRALSTKSLTFKKHPIKNILLTQLNIKLYDEAHVVERFLDVIRPICDNIKTALPQLWLSDKEKSDVDNIELPEEFLSISVGAAYRNKQIPESKIIQVVNQLDIHVVLLGGKEDEAKAKRIAAKTDDRVINMTGKLNILQSAELIRRSLAILSGDTGLMHIAAALAKPIVAMYGSTHPTLGYTPYTSSHVPHYIIQNDQISCRPCTKQGGNSCPKGHFKCMHDIKTEDIIEKIKSLV